MISVITTPLLVKGLGVLWPVLIMVSGVFISLFTASKVMDLRMKSVETDILDLKKETKELRASQLVAEREIGKTLSNIELKLGELTTIVKIYMEQNPHGH